MLSKNEEEQEQEEQRFFIPGKLYCLKEQEQITGNGKEASSYYVFFEAKNVFPQEHQREEDVYSVVKKNPQMGSTQQQLLLPLPNGLRIEVNEPVMFVKTNRYLNFDFHLFLHKNRIVFSTMRLLNLTPKKFWVRKSL